MRPTASGDMRGADGPGPGAGAAAETLHESEHTRITRLFLPSSADWVICKEPLGPASDERMRRELAMLERLDGVDGVRQLADVPARVGCIMLKDVDGVSLREAAKPLPPDQVVRIGADLAGTVAAMHRRGVVHRNINPANILLSRPQGTPWLIDFERATPVVEVPSSFSHANEVGGTQAYLAPEQTGRTGRPVDQRADLYALGATLYELVTGQRPFATTDRLRLSHDQLARVPAAPAQVNPAVTSPLSNIIMRLLQKDPDSRYQTAEGLQYDLTELADGREAAPEGASSQLGTHDFPVRLRAPSRLVGREAEISKLATAFADAMAGRCRGVLVSGAPGVGKSSLFEELRPVVAASGGRFVTGKFDQYRRDQDFDAVRQATRELGRLLLAEPEEELVELRPHILRSVGANAGLLGAVLPEFSVLLGVPAEPTVDDPLKTQVRLQQVAVDLIRAVASPRHPLVIALDDLQWAARTPLSFVDAVLSWANIDGLLLVGVYREGEVDDAHPLGALLPRWRDLEVPPTHVRLGNLPATELAALLADMLHLDVATTTGLADAIAPRTGGNPFDTVELVNALRRDGALQQADEGWRWNTDALGRYLGQAGVADLLVARMDAQPAQTRTLLETMACLGGKVDARLLHTATGEGPDVIQRRLAPALEDGLLIMEPGDDFSVQFRHDRIQESTLRHLTPKRRQAMRLDLARRLAGDPDLLAVAAEQYLPVIDLVQDPDERRRVADLLHRAANQALLLSNNAVVERLLAAAARLLPPDDPAALVELETGRLTALYSLGRLTEADDVYRAVDRLSTNALERTDATLVQVSSLTNRRRPHEALTLGLDLLGQLGMTVPPRERLDNEIAAGLDALYRWMDESDHPDDLASPEVDDPSVRAQAALVNRLMPPAFFCDQPVMAWLTVKAIALWATHGPDKTLVGPFSHVAFVTTPRRHDYRTGRDAMRRLLAMSEARRYEPDTSQARFLYALGTGHWFEPLQDNVRLAHQARDGLAQGGDLQNACFSYYASVPQRLEYEPSLDSYVVEVESALTFADRTGNEQSAEMYRAYRHLVHILRGEGDAGPDGAVDDPEEHERQLWQGLADNPNAVAHLHVTHGLAAALFGDRERLAHHAAAAMPLLPCIEATYPTFAAHFLRAMALSDQARSAERDERAAVLTDLDAMIDWLAQRADDAPANFAHLLTLVRAERSWAVGDFLEAYRAFDAAQREVRRQQRPWHQAYILERSAQFLLEFGIEHGGHKLLGDARRVYEIWGATAKVADLDRNFPLLWSRPRHGANKTDGRARDPVTQTASITTGAIDVLGVLEASRALSSETTLEGLRARVIDVLSAMTGATTVHVVLWDDARKEWLLPTPDGGRIPLDQPESQRLVPLSAVRYAERTREPLVVTDATRDGRFSRDPYLTNVDRCSMLVVPILNRGMLQALLLLENRLIRGAFSADRLDAVMMIAGQLAVSLDNALVYSSLERKVAERTQALAVANERLEQLSVTDPLTGLANRRRLEDVLDAEWHRAQRSGQSLGVAMVDVDHFKLYNDHYGHQAGDECLKRVAAELNRNVRETDLAVRYGGEEFTIVMPDTEIDEAEQLAQHLLTAVQSLAEPHPLAAKRIVTVSVGVGAMRPSGQSTQHELVQLADIALYRAKRNGRDRVETSQHVRSATR